MALNASEELIYEYVSLVVSEFEKASLRSEKREGFLVAANGPLTAMDNMLEGSDKVLGAAKDSRNAAVGVPQASTSQATTDEFAQERSALREETPHLVVGGNIVDEDISELFGGEENPVRNYLEECLGCDLRLTFDWQVKPINLLGPIADLLDRISSILDALKEMLNPFKILDGLCNLLDQLKIFCIPDLIALLMALKLLLKRYITEAINIQLDWTVLLGPILKAIVEAITSLISNLAAIILAPLDCALTSLYAARELEKQALDTAGQITNFAKQTASDAKAISEGGLPGNLQLQGLQRNYEWAGSTLGEDKYPEAPEFGRLNTTQSTTLNPPADDPDKVGVPSGFQLSNRTTVQEALADPAFTRASLVEKLIVPVQDARNYIHQLVDNILYSIKSLENLCAGGIALQVGNIGILVFIKDMISLVMMFIQMLRMNKNIASWCDYLEENPQLLEDGLRSRFGPVRVEPTKDSKLILRQGPKIVGEIKTCSSQRSEVDKQVLNQWIKDLEIKRTSR